MSKFAVGELLIITQTAPWWSLRVGDEVTVMQVVEEDTYCPSGPGYFIGFDPNGARIFGCHCCLKRKRPPQDWNKLAKLDEVPSDCVREREVVT